MSSHSLYFYEKPELLQKLQHWWNKKKSGIKLFDIHRADSRFAPSQWGTALLCNDVYHWLGANIEPALLYTWFQPNNNIISISMIYSSACSFPKRSSPRIYYSLGGTPLWGRKQIDISYLICGDHFWRQIGAVYSLWYMFWLLFLEFVLILLCPLSAGNIYISYFLTRDDLSDQQRRPASLSELFIR